MPLLLHLVMVGGGPRPKDRFSLSDQVLVPVLALIRMYVKRLGSFRQGAIFPDGGQGHFGLKGGRVISS